MPRRRARLVLVPRRRARLVLSLAALAALSSASPDEASLEVLESMPGPFFTLTDRRTVVDWLVTVTASPEAFPPEGDWTELFEVELDAEEEGLDIDDRALFGRLARVAPDGRTVLPSTVARVDANDRGTLVLTDRAGYSPCFEGVCRKQYVVRFVMIGFGDLSTRWFIRAGIDWARDDLEVPEAAALTLEVRLL